MTGTDVQRIEFSNHRACDVQVNNSAGKERFEVRREVLLCAGAIESPKLLQLSGIGPAALLNSLGISVLHDAPRSGVTCVSTCTWPCSIGSPVAASITASMGLGYSVQWPNTFCARKDR